MDSRTSGLTPAVSPWTILSPPKKDKQQRPQIGMTVHARVKRQVARYEIKHGARGEVPFGRQPGGTDYAVRHMVSYR